MCINKIALNNSKSSSYISTVYENILELPDGTDISLTWDVPRPLRDGT